MSFSPAPQVYGETSFELICQILDKLHPISGENKFVDLGSGVGQVIVGSCIKIQLFFLPFLIGLGSPPFLFKPLTFFSHMMSKFIFI